ncbi:MAG: hypothetical protein ACJAUE_001730 [Alcanivorax sp.]
MRRAGIFFRVQKRVGVLLRVASARRKKPVRVLVFAYLESQPMEGATQSRALKSEELTAFLAKQWGCFF